MKIAGKASNVRVSQGRDIENGKTYLVQHGYHFALFCTRGSCEVKSWKNFDWDDYHAEGFVERVTELFTTFRDLGWEHALITLSDAETPTAGLALFQLEGVELARFLTRHPMRTLKVIAKFGEADGRAMREYVGTVVGGEEAL